MSEVKLPEEVEFEGLSLVEAIENRRSERRFTGEPISPLELSQLLYYAHGITDSSERLRAAPSAGALYPIEIYPVVNSVEGLDGGIYRYSPQGHSLLLIREGDFRREMARYALGQDMLARASVVFLLSAVFGRSEWRYGERAYRYILLEAGHISQNIYLIATSLGLGACAVGAFSDDEFNRMLGVDGRKEGVLYLMAVGKLRWRN
jgi:SagB-type dehydrogenase family enzyme